MPDSDPAEKLTWAEIRRSLRSGPEREELLNSPTSDWARPRSRRRALVAGYAALTLVAAALLGLTDPDRVGIAIVVGALVAFIAAEVVVIGALNAATRGVVDLSRRHIDERQRQERGAAYEAGYKIGFGVVVVALAVLAFGDAGRWVLPVAVLVFNTLLMLPTLVVAWTADE